MIKNKLLVALTFVLIPIPLIWSATQTTVGAETQTLEIQESNVENVEVDDEPAELKKAPAPAPDTLEIPKTPIKNPSTQTEVETTDSLTGLKTRSYPSIPASTTGAKAKCSLISWKIGNAPANNAAQITCDIYDTSDDGNSVYVDWWLDGYGKVRLSNTRGYSPTPTHETDARKVPSDAISHAYWRVCRDISFWPDNCSATKSWKVN